VNYELENMWKDVVLVCW